MSFLIDTNVLLRSAEPTHPHHEAANRAIARLFERNETLIIVPQVIYEYWVVATRPLESNGLDFTSQATRAEIDKFKTIFILLEDEKELLARWMELVLRFDVRGKSAHDARLIAAMEIHGIPSLLTFNSADFSRYSNITVMNPQIVATE
jgi:predicted nucleic acid-binding protein